MPHRLQHIPFAFSSMFEGITLSLIASYQLLAEAIDETSWTRLTGAHGTLFVLAIGIIVLWNAARVREKKEDARRKDEGDARERQHTELVSTNKENAEGLKALTVESIKSNMKSTAAIENMDKHIQILTAEIRDRGNESRELTKLVLSSPCLLAKAVNKTEILKADNVADSPRLQTGH